VETPEVYWSCLAALVPLAAIITNESVTLGLAEG